MTYKGFDILNWVVPIDTASLEIDNKVNIIGDYHQNRAIHIQYGTHAKVKFNISLDGATARYNYKEFFKDKKGKHGRFFLPSFKKDYHLMEDITSGSFSVRVSRAEDFTALNTHPQFIYVQRTETVHRVDSVEESFDDTLGAPISILNLREAIPDSVPKDCGIIENCYFGRYGSDTLTFDLYDITYSTASLEFVEVSKEEIIKEFG